MLFSDKSVADNINNKFEPVWQSVRPVPIVKIDFGTGNVITRTLHGNIATYVCDSSGQVLDILPGIYDPQKYTEQLSDLASVATEFKNKTDSADANAYLVSYHKQGGMPKSKPWYSPPRSDMSKIAIERPVEMTILPSLPPAAPLQFRSEEEKRDFDTILLDTTVNETVRRSQIHSMLSSLGPVRPEKVQKWLYKEVLHADLDDPYLGLGPTLFASYPFRD